MLTRRVCASARSVLSMPNNKSALPRAFTTSAAIKSSARAPALADITPESVASFTAKQKEFREGIVAAQKRKEQEESKFYSCNGSLPSPSSIPRFNATRKTRLVTNVTFLEDARAREQESGKKKGGALSSLIYGTPEGRELDKDIERSFSQVLARGKYVHSIVFHEVKPDKVDEYTELVGNWYTKMASIPENKVHLVGSWRTEVGDCNTFGKPSSCLYLLSLCASLTTLANSTHLGIPKV